MHAAARQAPEQERVDGAEGELAGHRARPRALDVIDEPGDFRGRKVGVEPEPGAREGRDALREPTELAPGDEAPFRGGDHPAPIACEPERLDAPIRHRKAAHRFDRVNMDGRDAHAGVGGAVLGRDRRSHDRSRTIAVGAPAPASMASPRAPPYDTVNSPLRASNNKLDAT